MKIFMKCVGYPAVAVFSTFMTVTTLTQAVAAEKISTSTVSYLSGKDTVRAYLCVPEGVGPFPAVMVIHEWWGLNDWIRFSAERLAKEGFVTLALDLYRGRVADSAGEAHELMRGLPEDRVSRDLRAGFAYLKGMKSVKPEKIGSVGWCMGGGYSLQAAVTIPELSATVICYGRLVTDSAAIAGIHAPLLGIFGSQDRGISEESVREFEKTCRGLGKNIDLAVYPDAGHAFMNPGNTDGFRGKDAEDAWVKILSFLSAKLK